MTITADEQTTPINTNAFLYENADISMHLVLSFTLVRSAFSWKAHRFEDTLESGSKRKRIHIVFVWTVEIGPSQARVFASMRIEFSLTPQRAILSFSNVLTWTVENASKR